MSAEPQQSNVINIEQQLEDQHLAHDHRLVKVQAYIKDKDKAEKKTANAKRVADFRERQKEAGLVQTALPSEVAQSIKDAGSFEAWMDGVRSSPPRTVEKVVEVEKKVEVVREVLKVERVDVPASLSAGQVRLIELGRAVEQLPAWRRWLAGL